MRVRGEVERAAPSDAPGRRAELETRDLPLVLEGQIEAWGARGRAGWDADGLRRRIGDRPARYKRSRSHRHPDFGAGDPAGMFATEASTFGELIDRITSGASDAARCFLTGDEEYVLRRRPGLADDWNPKLAPLRGDYQIPEWLDPGALYTIWLWISGSGVRSWLHYDTNGCHNLNAQVRGSKRFWLFPPEELPRLYPFELCGEIPAYNCCQVDLEAPDPGRFPGFEEAECLEGELCEGDLLFLPVDWIHAFLHTGPFNVNLNFWWRPPRVRHSLVSARRELLDRIAGLGERSLSPDVRRFLTELDRSLVHGAPAT